MMNLPRPLGFELALQST
ncbi:MAG: hypothetical protein ACKVIF_02350, partial [Rhodospirillales bacterium]